MLQIQTIQNSRVWGIWRGCFPHQYSLVSHCGVRQGQEAGVRSRCTLVLGGTLPLPGGELNFFWRGRTSGLQMKSSCLPARPTSTLPERSWEEPVSVTHCHNNAWGNPPQNSGAYHNKHLFSLLRSLLVSWGSSPCGCGLSGWLQDPGQAQVRSMWVHCGFRLQGQHSSVEVPLVANQRRNKGQIKSHKRI